MKIKLLALDIDGTLIKSNAELSDRNRSAIERAISLGVYIVLLTGRRFGSALQLIQKLNLELPIISHNGALIKRSDTLETIRLHPLDVNTAHDIIMAGRKDGVDMICCVDEPDGIGKIVIDNISEENIYLWRYIDKYKDSLLRVDDLIKFVENPPIQIMFSGTCNLVDNFNDKLKSLINGKVSLVKTRYRNSDLTILDVLSGEASKGHTLAELAVQLGISRENVMAVGDNHNDLSMLHYAGTGVIMANAEEELKNHGFPVTSSNEEDGVAEAIEKYIFTE